MPPIVLFQSDFCSTMLMNMEVIVQDFKSLFSIAPYEHDNKILFHVWGTQYGLFATHYTLIKYPYSAYTSSPGTQQ